MNLKSLAGSRLTGRSLAIAPVRLDGMLATAAALGPGADLPSWLQDMTRSQGYTVTESGIAIVPVLGPLVTRGDWLTMLLGATEYGIVADAMTRRSRPPQQSISIPLPRRTFPASPRALSVSAGCRCRDGRRRSPADCHPPGPVAIRRLRALPVPATPPERSHTPGRGCKSAWNS